jgi:acetyl-CoA synthetase
MAEMGKYEDRLAGFTWSIAEQELDYHRRDPLNIGWHCTDRICRLGKADKIALYYEGFGGIDRKYTFNDLRLHTNTIGSFLRNLGLKPEDRICLFMDRIPELYFSFLGILKIGAIVQPLFSAFGEESLFVRLGDAGTRAKITQRKYLSRIRKIVPSLPQLEFIIVVDHQKDKGLETNEIPFCLDEAAPVENLALYSSSAESPSVLHYTSGTTGQPKGV